MPREGRPPLGTSPSTFTVKVKNLLRHNTNLNTVSKNWDCETSRRVVDSSNFYRFMQSFHKYQCLPSRTNTQIKVYLLQSPDYEYQAQAAKTIRMLRGG